ncbi:glycine zipper 2TM domain-containing protein [Pseudochrobactrum algeriensis]|uniref:Outer membrane lipoprotein SlyB n=1 Tax=Pseudochrobactrum saccharolyticum TaxID=354352 RepID=A0A7W8ALI1_9HYPH|nr:MULTISPECIES: glycine zipper 2TM domain-containing protein [Brucellaceae]MBX8784653.1 glycine zipper 2TM domain-containing protein [Ochrobactrum sp. GRS2]MBX8813944.1 glycine zipper 2TM domain-containing protein [Ochrobactrum sp. MR34]HWD12441.1 glycine zipper 2TM domain-containing protein [Pseudochrobactrum sp.]KAB0536950.1 glycine zipper 2TM domain-containing protein [Pseudochrobactrum saccharolyticum]MBB5092495.1 outer membrane lipoprotein SlyB [Pseudochrobactrum saccharolyticum]
MKSRLSMIAVTAVLAFSTVACTTGEQRTAGYGVGGAALGALAGGAIGGNGRGALTGAAIGAVAGTLLGAAQTRNGVQYCRYRDNYGRVYEAPCN